MPTTNGLLRKLAEVGFSEECVQASLPEWWTPEEESSPSAQMLVSLLLARRLNLDPESLLDDGVPVGFLHTGPTKFKHLRLPPGERFDALMGFAQGVSRIVLSEVESDGEVGELAGPDLLRAAILESDRTHVGFGDILTLCWSLGIPVLHLRLFPAKMKGITAMAVRLGTRHVILVARESGVSAQYMFHVAHELGHIALGHLDDVAAIVDADPYDPLNRADALVEDEQEVAADAFAQHLIAGRPDFTVKRLTDNAGPPGKGKNPMELARRAMQAGQELQIDPGHIIMCFGRETGEWALATSAAKLIPDQEQKPGTLVNSVFWEQIAHAAGGTSAPFLRAVAPI